MFGILLTDKSKVKRNTSKLILYFDISQKILDFLNLISGYQVSRLSLK
ncbi:hypothetical protein FDUTEX481_08441 [Tolypothrix sp. PCC 7601]|nr:hypothetical protein FDUTEX481_08441 [Tolypothrix sp. PCC 7601]